MEPVQFWEILARRGSAERKLRDAFKQRGTELVTTYRHGPYKLEALFRLVETNHYWTVTSQATREHDWSQSELDAGLHEDLVRQLDNQLHEQRGENGS